MRKSMADAELDDRVARADARDKYRATVQRAREQLKRDYARADTALILAQANHRSAVAAYNAIKARFTEMGDVPLRQEYERLSYMLTPQYAIYTNPDEKARVTVMVRMILAALESRGLDVS